MDRGSWFPNRQAGFGKPLSGLPRIGELAVASVMTTQSLGPTLNAAIGQLGEAELLDLFSAVGQAVKTKCLDRRPVLSSWPVVLDYLRSAIGREPIEQFRIMFLDKRNHLIADEVMGVGTIDHCPVYVREILRRAIELGSTALVLVHNHPSGDPTPSQADVTMTKVIVEACKLLGIAVHDHVIVGRDETASLKALQLM
jgi:DNA repair protein RadC